MKKQAVSDAKRYRIRIDNINYYVIVTDDSISVSYAYENREERIEMRKALEKYCEEVSRRMQAERIRVRAVLEKTREEVFRRMQAENDKTETALKKFFEEVSKIMKEEKDV